MSDPMDEIVENDLKKTRKSTDPYLNSIDPPGLEGTGLGKNDEEFIDFQKGEAKEEERKESEDYSEDSFEEIPADRGLSRKKAKEIGSEDASEHVA